MENYGKFVESKFKSSQQLQEDMPKIKISAMRRMHAIAGLIGEIGEFMDKPSVDEAGDVSFYLVAFLNTLDADISWYVEGTDDHPLKITSAILELVKKEVFYLRDVDLEKYRELGGRLSYALVVMFDRHAIDPDEAIAHNVAKLSARYAKGFSKAEAVQRSDES